MPLGRRIALVASISNARSVLGVVLIPILPVTSNVELIVAALLTSKVELKVAASVTVNVELNVVALLTSKVELKVVASVTSNVELRVVASVTPKVELKVAALATLNVELRVVASVTPKVELNVVASLTAKVDFKAAEPSNDKPALKDTSLVAIMVPDTSKLPFAVELALPMATLLSDTARSCCTSPSSSPSSGAPLTSNPPAAKERAPASAPAPAKWIVLLLIYSPPKGLSAEPRLLTLPCAGRISPETVIFSFTYNCWLKEASPLRTNKSPPLMSTKPFT